VYEELWRELEEEAIWRVIIGGLLFLFSVVLVNIRSNTAKVIKGGRQETRYSKKKEEKGSRKSQEREKEANEERRGQDRV